MSTFRIYRDPAGEFRWRLEGLDGQVIADSGKGYVSRSDCREAVDHIMHDAPFADVLDET